MRINYVYYSQWMSPELCDRNSRAVFVYVLRRVTHADVLGEDDVEEHAERKQEESER